MCKCGKGHEWTSRLGAGGLFGGGFIPDGSVVTIDPVLGEVSVTYPPDWRPPVKVTGMTREHFLRGSDHA